MEKEQLIKKWLDNELTADELLAFKQLEEYDSYVKLSDKAKLFKAPAYDNSVEYEKLGSVTDKNRNNKSTISKLTPIIQIAAVLVIGVIIYSVFFINNLITIDTLASQKTTVTLPDVSTVELNSLSHLSYSKNKWSKKREVTLEGEAFFKVAKGSMFNVQTTYGVVSVLGTQFNVKNRENYFEVVCFEGLVSVLYNDKLTKIPAGSSFRVINDSVSNDSTNLQHPTWLDHISSFKSVPFAQVINEFERQYNVKIITNFDTNILFTGTFSNDDKIKALRSITLPMSLDFKIEKNLITLKKVE